MKYTNKVFFPLVPPPCPTLSTKVKFSFDIVELALVLVKRTIKIDHNRYQEKFRIFLTGGQSRDFYINLSTGLLGRIDWKSRKIWLEFHVLLSHFAYDIVNPTLYSYFCFSFLSFSRKSILCSLSIQIEIYSRLIWG